MSIDLNDPRLTAYALGELDGAERAEFERLTAADPSAAAAVEGIRQVAAALRAELAHEEAPQLSADRREKIALQAAGGADNSDDKSRHGRSRDRKVAAAASGGARIIPFRWLGLSVAAAAVIAIGVWVFWVAGGDARNGTPVAATSGNTPAAPSAVRRSKGMSGGEYMRDERIASGHEAGRFREDLDKSAEAAGPTGPAAGPASSEPPSSSVVHGEGTGGKYGVPTGAPAPTRPPGAPALRPGQPSRTGGGYYYDGGAKAGNEKLALDYSKSSGARGGDGWGKGRGTGGGGSGRDVKGKEGDARHLSDVGVSGKPPGDKDLTKNTARPGPAGEATDDAKKGLDSSPAAHDEELADALEELSGQRSGEDGYDTIVENSFDLVGQRPLSTFSIDVDTASYANLRRMIEQQGVLPPKHAVRIEELVNYFHYDYPQPKDEHPLSINTDVAACPWNPAHRLVRVGLQAKVLDPAARPAGNLVFLLDCSGSMSDANKLSLVKSSMLMLLDRLDERDHVAIVTYSTEAKVALESTNGKDKDKIREVLNGLRADGSTNGAGGIQLAYEQAAKSFIAKGSNRVILCTDGDFNVGVSDDDSLVKLMKEKAKSGVFLTVLGFGMGNIKDGKLEKIADKGNGSYGYIDTADEAKRLLVDQFGGLTVLAKDVKLQIEFNPAKVSAYRLLGYEDRMLAAEDFNNDKKDAGELGVGQTVTALYEVVPAGEKLPQQAVDELRYQKKPAEMTPAASSEEIMTVKVRYKAPDGDKSTLVVHPVADSGEQIRKAPSDFRFAAAVASFGMILRDSQYRGAYTLPAVYELAKTSLGDDRDSKRKEFVALLEKTMKLTVKSAKAAAPTEK